MPMIEWNGDFSVGNEEIDEQHKILIGMLNEIEAIIQREDFTRLNIVGTVEKLEEYVKTHFDYEEALMADSSYPMIMEHSNAHNDFRIKSQNIFVLDIEQPKDFYVEMMEYLMKWWSEHILEVDKQLGNYLSD